MSHFPGEETEVPKSSGFCPRQQPGRVGAASGVHSLVVTSTAHGPCACGVSVGPERPWLGLTGSFLREAVKHLGRQGSSEAAGQGSEAPGAGRGPRSVPGRFARGVTDVCRRCSRGGESTTHGLRQTVRAACHRSPVCHPDLDPSGRGRPVPAAFVRVAARTKQDGLAHPLLAARREPEIRLRRLRGLRVKEWAVPSRAAPAVTPLFSQMKPRCPRSPLETLARLP